MKYYKGLDIPMFNWFQIQDGLTEYVRIDQEIGTEEEDAKYIELIQDAYYNEFGISKEYLNILRLQDQLADAKLDWIIENNTFLLNKIRRLQNEIDEILARPVESDMDSSVIALSKWIGYRIDQKIVTLKEFYKMVEMYAKEVETIKAQQAAKK